MRLLLDTHALLWFLTDHPQLSRPARDLMTNQDNQLLFSMASCWEIAIKVNAGKLQLTKPFPQFIDDAQAIMRTDFLPINLRHLTKLVELPLHHRDPFDRLLAAQACVEDIGLVSVDSNLDAYGVRRFR